MKELIVALERLNVLIEKTGKRISLEGRNDYICFDIYKGEQCVEMAMSFKTTKEAIKNCYNMIKILSL